MGLRGFLSGRQVPVAGIVVCAMVLAAITPAVTFVLALCAVAAQLAVCALNLTAPSASRQSATKVNTHPEATCRPMFSVHVPTHDEPPGLVIATLAALGRQVDAPDFEVIVIDNNTADPARWRPVEAWCAGQPDRFRFLHRLDVPGAKAGALNLALAATSPRATHVVTVDADYCVTPDFLAVAATEIVRRDSSFVQFPQAYRHAEDVAGGVSLELADYFSRHATAASGVGALLLTGTLSVIDIAALRSVGGWSSRTATEDADLGLRLARAGYRGRFVDRVVGKGLMPLDLRSLDRQRHRWAAGNIRTALHGVADTLASGRGLGLRQGLLAASQLTAWANFAAPATLTLLAAQMQIAAGGGDLSTATTLVSIVTLVLALLSAIYPLVRAGRRADQCPHNLATAVATRIALLPTSAAATMAGLLPRSQRFSVTPKAFRRNAPAIPFMADMPQAAIVAVGAGLAAALVPIAAGQPPALLLFAVFAAPFAAAQVSRVSLRRYAVRVAQSEA